MGTAIGRHGPWALVGALGAAALAIVATERGETVNALWIVVAAVCVYLIAYRYYSKFIAEKVMRLDPKRQTPAVRHNDGLDYVPTNRGVLFGHHFAAIAGAGPLVGPVLAAQMGYLPGMLWILAGVVLAGAVQDFMVLFVSMRRDGRSLGELIRAELGTMPGIIALFGTFLIMVILLAVLALIVVKALAESPWGTFTVMSTIPIAMLMGVYSRYIRPGKIGEVSILGFVLLMLAIMAGGSVAASPVWGPAFTFTGPQLCWMLIGYGFVASILPVWLLLAPRDYLSTFLKIGTIVGLALGIAVVAPHLQMPAVTKFVDGTGPVWAGSLFPFLFITIACGSVSGFHALISSGTTPKLIASEADARFIGYGGMLMESFVAIMALVSACVIDPGRVLHHELAGRAGRHDPRDRRRRGDQARFRHHPGGDHPDRRGCRRAHDHLAGRRRADPRGRHGPHHLLGHRRQDDDGLLVPLRDPVRGAVHPHGRGCGHPRLPVHGAGPRRARGAVVQEHHVVGAKHRGDRHLGGGLGLLPVSGRDRPARRHQHPVAALRHLEPDAGRGGADALHGGDLQDEARALRVRDHHPDRVAVHLHPYGRLAEDLLGRSRRSASWPMPSATRPPPRRARSSPRPRTSIR